MYQHLERLPHTEQEGLKLQPEREGGGIAQDSGEVVLRARLQQHAPEGLQRNQLPPTPRAGVRQRVPGYVGGDVLLPRARQDVFPLAFPSPGTGCFASRYRAHRVHDATASAMSFNVENGEPFANSSLPGPPMTMPVGIRSSGIVASPSGAAGAAAGGGAGFG